MRGMRVTHYKKDRQAMTLSHVPVGDYFQLVTDKYGHEDLKDIPPNIPFGCFRKIAFQTLYGRFNVMDMWTAEVRDYRDDCLCIRIMIPLTVEFEESRFDRPINKETSCH